MNAQLIYYGQNGGTIDLFKNEYLYLVNADGLTGVSSSISSATTPGMDGDRVTNIQAQPRGIVLDMRVKQGANVEDAKRFVLRTMKPKQRGTLRFLQADREVEIPCIVESINMPRFTDAVAMQISLYCPQPFWRDVENVLVEIARVINAHYFPVAFPVDGVVMGEYDLNMTRTYTNDGDAACGMVISVIALGNVLNPVIYKADGSYIGVNDSMVVGDEILINTNQGEKGITKNGVNILSKIRGGSTFIQLETGDNELTIDSDGGTEGNVYFTLTFKRRFI